MPIAKPTTIEPTTAPGTLSKLGTVTDDRHKALDVALGSHTGITKTLVARDLVKTYRLGGSVIGAYFHRHFHGEGGDFATFETKIRALLAQGLAAPMCRDVISENTERKSVVSARSRPSYNCSCSSPGHFP